MPGRRVRSGARRRRRGRRRARRRTRATDPHTANRGRWLIAEAVVVAKLVADTEPACAGLPTGRGRPHRPHPHAGGDRGDPGDRGDREPDAVVLLRLRVRPVRTDVRELQRRREQEQHDGQARGQRDGCPAWPPAHHQAPVPRVAHDAGGELPAPRVGVRVERERLDRGRAARRPRLHQSEHLCSYGVSAAWSCPALVRTTKWSGPISSRPTIRRAAKSSRVADTVAGETSQPPTSSPATAGGSVPRSVVSGPASGNRRRRAHVAARATPHSTAPATAATRATSARPWKPSKPGAEAITPASSARGDDDRIRVDGRDVRQR